MLKMGSLFSGAGLCDLGLSWAGFRHQWFCEIDPSAGWFSQGTGRTFLFMRM